MEFVEIQENKKQYLDLLLLADEQESMIDRYLDRGAMYVLRDGGVKAECVVTDEGNGVLEIKNLAVYPACQRKGYGSRLVEFVARRYSGAFGVLRVGTGDCPAAVSFYTRCGFAESGRIPNFFLDHYDHPMFECGVQLVDMVCYERKLI